MLQLFDDRAIGSIGRPAAARSALWSVVIHGSVFLFLLSLGLSPAFQALPEHANLVRIVAPLPAPPPPPPPPPAATAARVPVRRTARVFTAKLTAPSAVPKVAPVQDLFVDAAPEIAAGVPGGIPGGIANGVLGGVVGGIPAAIGLPPPPPAPAPQAPARPEPPPAPRRIQVNAEVQEASLLHMVRPKYPVTAKIGHVGGVVRLRAIIDREGRITELTVVEGNPVLAAAARAAVAQWRYRPTYLNGEPVEVATEIVVTFRLS